MRWGGGDIRHPSRLLLLNLQEQQTDSQAADHCRYFLSYSGVKLPLNLVSEIDEAATENRNTYFCAFYDGEGVMLGCEKRVYGEVEMEHRYSYHDDGMIGSAEITIGAEEPQRLEFPHA